MEALLEAVFSMSPLRGYIARPTELSELVEKMSGRDPQGAWRQDELIGCKPPSVK
jgi:hypothetical protein